MRNIDSTSTKIEMKEFATFPSLHRIKKFHCTRSLETFETKHKFRFWFGKTSTCEFVRYSPHAMHIEHLVAKC